MIVNYIKIAWRNIWNNKFFSLVNILGLSIGIACSFLIMLYVNDELNFDQFLENKENLYRVTTDISNDGQNISSAASYHPLAPILENTLPHESKVVRYMPYSILVTNPEKNSAFQESKFYFADSLFFYLFDFEFVLGSPENALSSIKNIVVTETTAKRYFGEENPIGKILFLEAKKDFQIAAVIKDLPVNSSLQFDFIASIESMPNIFYKNFFHPNGAWYHPPLYTFASIPDKTFVKNWDKLQPQWKTTNLPEHIQTEYSFNFQKITDVHFQSLENDFTATVNRSFLWVLTIVALMILGIAFINYVNLSMSKIIRRFPELGIRKVIGAQNKHIILQLIIEGSQYLLLALILGIGFVHFRLNAFNALVDKDLVLYSPENLKIFFLLGVIVFSTLIIISSIPYISILKKSILPMINGRAILGKEVFHGFSLKNGLMIFQFAIAVGLIISSLVIGNQLQYLQNKNLGFNEEELLIVPIRDSGVQKNFAVIKNLFLSNKGVKEISALSNFPWENGFYDFTTTIRSKGKEYKHNIPTILVEEDFISTLDIEIKKGRDFSKDFSTDKNSAFILNAAAMEAFNIEDIEDAEVSMEDLKSGGPLKGQLIGVVNNFHMKSLHNPIDPLIIAIAPESYYLDNFVIRLESNELTTSLKSLESKWNEINPSRPFEYFFMDDAFDALYKKEAKMANIFFLFTALAIFIALLGILALSSLFAQYRIKEIGIRKVLGASSVGITMLLSKDFIRNAIIAIILSTPICYYILQEWLANFAFRIEIHWWFFIIPSFSIILITLSTVMLQTFKTAISNPVNSLRTE